MYKACCIIAGIALFLPLWVLAQPSPYHATETLASMRDKSRPLLIFDTERADARPLGPSLHEQRALFDRHEVDLKNRDVVLLYVPYSGFEGSVWTGLRRQFRVDDRQFTVVLVGKDGGEKFRSHVPVTIEKLDALIDAMPMRQQEVRDELSPK
jgi:hypothetical protein